MRVKTVPPMCPARRVYVPEKHQTRVVEWAHTSPAPGHPGVSRMLAVVASKYWWPHMARLVKTAAQPCLVCAMTKSSRVKPVGKPAGKLRPLPTPSKSWSHIAVDLVMDLPVSEGNTVIMVTVDCFSKGCRLIPFHSLPSVLEVAESLFQQVFCCYGILEEILFDSSPMSEVWKAFFKHLGVTVSLTSRYHPETNGQAERSIQELSRFLRACCNSQQHDWDRYLVWAEYAQNSKP